MIINYITGPAGCGKTRYLESIEAAAKRKGYPVLRPAVPITAQALQVELHRAKPNTVVLIDEGLDCGGIRPQIAYQHLLVPAGAQIFVAGEGALNPWNALI